LQKKPILTKPLPAPLLKKTHSELIPLEFVAPPRFTLLAQLSSVEFCGKLEELKNKGKGKV
jgi:hypothetical protein